MSAPTVELPVASDLYGARLVEVRSSTGVLLDVDLGFRQWRTKVPFRLPRERAQRDFVGRLAPGAAVVVRVAAPASTSPDVWRGRLALPGEGARPVFRYAVTVLGCHDGDNVLMDIALGLDAVWRSQSVRLTGCNANELDEPGGREALAELQRRVPAGAGGVLASVKPDKYGGRLNGRLALPGIPDLAEYLIGSGWAARWDGRGKAPRPVWPRPAFPAE